VNECPEEAAEPAQALHAREAMHAREALRAHTVQSACRQHRQV
jgi:hypothetical protein